MISINNNRHTPCGTQFNSSSTVFLSRIALSQSALHPEPIIITKGVGKSQDLESDNKV